jgi:hypothetical protein
MFMTFVFRFIFICGMLPSMKKIGRKISRRSLKRAKKVKAAFHRSKKKLNNC